MSLKLLPALLAVAMLVVIWMQTSEALRRSGAWTARRLAPVMTTDPYARLDGLLSRPDTAISAESLRDPFSYPRPPAPPRTAASRPTAPRPRPQPVVTAIVTGGQMAQAVVRYEGSSYSVKPGDRFAEFRVVSITANQVVVENGRQQFVLRPPTKGE
jgi:type IV pilus biogenesis protein PilP